MKREDQEENDSILFAGRGSFIRRNNELPYDKLTKVCESYARGQLGDHEGWVYSTEDR